MHPPTKSERTRRRVLDAAADVLAARGYAAMNLQAVAERAELKAGSLYYHFSSKDELVMEVLRRGTTAAHEAVTEALQQLGPAPDPIEALRAALSAHLLAVLAQGSYTTANIRSYGQLPDDLAEHHRKLQRSYGDTWRRLIADAVDSGRLRRDLDQRAIRLLLLGAMNWSIEWFDAEDSLTAQQLADHLAELAFDGLRPRADP